MIEVSIATIAGSITGASIACALIYWYHKGMNKL